MAHEPEELELRRRFASLREAERRLGAPGFDATWTRAAGAAGRRSRSPARWLLAGAALATAALLGVALFQRPTQREPVDVAMWESPTAMLLRTPGDALLREVPMLGSSAITSLPLPNFPRGIP